ncbi:MAG: hypothetical protein CM15mP117_10420 [Alphaproteobacteria bacterium]|nr:MAG: hypothetical protein CM15mP117_10420 [Alphaproteobacteria bacterium]
MSSTRPTDLDFARKYNLPVTEVVCPENEIKDSFSIGNVAYTGPGKIINSGDWNGLDIETAKEVAINAIENGNFGTKKVSYRLRDWGVSRQRYWGCPIPIIHCF